MSIVLFAVLSAVGQTPEIDSLKDLLRRHPVEDTFRVNAIIALSDEEGLPEKTVDSLLNAALYMSRRIKDTIGQITTLTWLSWSQPKDSAIQMSNQAVALSEKIADKTLKVRALFGLTHSLFSTPRQQEALTAALRGLAIAESSGDPHLISLCQSLVGDYYETAANHAMALEWLLKSLKTAERGKDNVQAINAHKYIGMIYAGLDDQDQAIAHYYRALALNHSKSRGQDADILNDLGSAFVRQNKFQQAVQTYLKALSYSEGAMIQDCEANLADVYYRLGNYASASLYAQVALERANHFGQLDYQGRIYSTLSDIHLKEQRIDSAIYFGKKGYAAAIAVGDPDLVRDNSEALSSAYLAKKDYANSLLYYKRFIAARDSVVNAQGRNKSNLVQYNYDLGKKQSEIDLLNKDKQLQVEQARRQRWLLASAVIGLVLILGIVAILYRNSRQRRKAYDALQRQKQEIQEQRDQTANALRELRQTQQQLIQSEKMASLGELTAGVAHEIQNPLNFVNNFAELNIELLAELAQGPMQSLTGASKVEADELISAIHDNLAKIAHHGKRAEGIVKGMLAHSRTGTGQKEATDLNALADECLRLSFHGLRAKDKSFNAKLETELDPAMGSVDLIRQDISRVLLNLCTNAFYSVAQKSGLAAPGYQPCVRLTTRRLPQTVVVTIWDNGLGIPKKILDKIYQPFFTTKPTGEGTGLGLSLSYDIVTKAHGGELAVDTQEGEYVQFTIRIPV